MVVVFSLGGASVGVFCCVCIVVCVSGTGCTIVVFMISCQRRRPLTLLLVNLDCSSWLL